MTIGFLSPEYPHPLATPSGGLGTSIKNLATSLVKRGIKVHVYLYSQKCEEDFHEDGIHFHFIKHRKYPLAGWYLHRKFLQGYLKDQIKKNCINIMEAPDWTGITAFMKLNCPLVVRLNGSDTYFCHLEGRKQKWKNFWFEKTALHNADHLISVSKFTAERTAALFGLKKKVSIIPNSLEVIQFQPGNDKENPDQVLYFGSLIRKKGILELAHIFNRIVMHRPQTQLLLVGKDVVDALENVSTLALFKNLLSAEAEKQVAYRSEVGYSEIREVIASSAVIVLPSFAEALPMTWLEAMAMEKALVTSNIGWANEVMQDGETGFTEAPNNHKAFAQKVLKLLDNPAQAEEMGKAARKQVCRKFSTEVVIEQNIEFYRRHCD